MASSAASRRATTSSPSTAAAPQVGLLRCPELERANLVDAGAAAAAPSPRQARLLPHERLGRRHRGRAGGARRDKLTLIGVSYGTFLAQAYAARYPTHVERVLLDSVLDVSGWDPFYRDIFGAVPRVLESVCRTTCAGFTRDEVDDLARLVALLGAARCAARDAPQRPPPQDQPDPPGAVLHARLGRPRRAPARVLPGRRYLCAAWRPRPDPAAQAPGDRVGGGGSPREFSSGLYAATTCEEIPSRGRASPTRQPLRPDLGGVRPDPRAGALPVRPRHRRGQRLHPHVPPLARGVAGPIRAPARSRTCRC